MEAGLTPSLLNYNTIYYNCNTGNAQDFGDLIITRNTGNMEKLRFHN